MALKPPRIVIAAFLVLASITVRAAENRSHTYFVSVGDLLNAAGIDDHNATYANDHADCSSSVEYRNYGPQGAPFPVTVPGTNQSSEAADLAEDVLRFHYEATVLKMEGNQSNEYQVSQSFADWKAEAGISQDLPGGLNFSFGLTKEGSIGDDVSIMVGWRDDTPGDGSVTAFAFVKTDGGMIDLPLGDILTQAIDTGAYNTSRMNSNNPDSFKTVFTFRDGTEANPRFDSAITTSSIDDIQTKLAHDGRESLGFKECDQGEDRELANHPNANGEEQPSAYAGSGGGSGGGVWDDPSDPYDGGGGYDPWDEYVLTGTYREEFWFPIGGGRYEITVSEFEEYTNGYGQSYTIMVRQYTLE